MVNGLGGVRNIAAVYNRQEFYAQRSHELNIPKTVQIGVQDKVSISPQAMSARAAMAPTAQEQTVVAAAFVAQSTSTGKAIAYEDPRRGSSARHGAEESGRDETSGTDGDTSSESAESAGAVAAAGESSGQQAAGK